MVDTPKSIDTALYDQRVAELDALCKQIVLDKRRVYTRGNVDTMRNFKVNAVLANSTIGQSVAFGLVKQLTAVVNLLTDPTVLDSELETRFADARNYLDIGYVLWREGQQHVKPL